MKPEYIIVDGVIKYISAAKKAEKPAAKKAEKPAAKKAEK